MRLPILTALTLAVAVPMTAQTATPAPANPAAFKMTPEQQKEFLALGKKYTQWFLSGRADSLATGFDEESFQKMGGMEGILTQMGQIAERAGTEVKILEEKMTYRNGIPQFWHEGSFSEFTDQTLVFRWLLNAKGKIIGAGIQPRSAAPEPDPIF